MTKARTLADFTPFDSSGVLTSASTLDATKLSGALPVLDGSALTNLPASATNTPAFLTKISSSQAIANNSDTTLQFDSSVDGFDTDSGFNAGTYTYTIPSGEGGKYFMYAGTYLHSDVADKFVVLKFITTQGTKGETYTGSINANVGVQASAQMIQNFNAGDTVFMRIYHNFGGSRNTASGIQNTYFGGFKLAE